MRERPDAITRFDVIYSDEQAALIHAAHRKWGVWMSPHEAKVRFHVDFCGLSEILRTPAEVAEMRHEAAKAAR